MSTLTQLIASLQTIQNPDGVTVPLLLQNVSEENFNAANTYDSLLAENKYADAVAFRKEHPELDASIIDADKFNILQGFILDAYFYAKDLKQQCIVSAEEPVNQVEGDFWFKITTVKNGIAYTVPHQKQADGTYVQFSLTDQDSISNLDSRLKSLERVKEYTLPVNGWGDAIPHIQTIIDVDISSTDAPFVSLKFESGDTIDDIYLKQIAFDRIQRVVTNDGMISFYCYDKIPDIAIKVIAKGV